MNPTMIPRSEIRKIPVEVWEADFINAGDVIFEAITGHEFRQDNERDQRLWDHITQQIQDSLSYLADGFINELEAAACGKKVTPFMEREWDFIHGELTKNRRVAQ